MLLHHRYQLIHDLAEGSFGKTFLAEDTQMPTRQRCVIKQLKPVNDDRPDVVQLIEERFAREAAVLEAVGQGHSQIPNLLAYFETEGQFYLVQEWVEGTPLSALVKTPWAEDKVAALLASALDALAHVHAQNIIHRDLKPDNIILRQSDSLPCLIDFGAVKELMNTVVVPSESQASSVVIGTLGFMAPEQAVGRPVFSSDLYSLGMTAIYLLTARSPLEIPTDSLNGRLLWNQFAPHVSPRLAGILTRAIHPYPPTRFTSATDMLAVLTEQTIGQSIEQQPPVISPSNAPPAPNRFETEISFPSSGPATQIGSPATQIGSPATQIGSPATQLTANTEFNGNGFKSTDLAIAPPQGIAAPAGNPYYSLTPNDDKKKANGAFFLKVGGAVVGALVVGAVSVLGYSAVSSKFAGGALDASSPERLEQAILKLEKSVAARPDDYDTRLQLIEAYVHQGSYNKALTQIGDLEQNSASNAADNDSDPAAQALYWQGAVEINQGKYSEAITTLTQSIALDGDEAATLNLLGRAYQEIGQYDNALARYQTAATAEPDDVQALVNQASINEVRGDFQAAKALLEEAETDLATDDKIGFYLFAGNFHVGLNEIEQAETYWKKVSHLSPQNAGDYAAKGLGQGLLGNIDNAMESFEQALDINPNSLDTYLSRGIIHFRQGNIDAVMADVEAAIAINPNAVTAYQIRANVEASRSEPNVTAAVEAATQGLEINPHHPTLLSERCGGYFLLSQFEKAIADCTNSIEINPTISDAYNARGQSYFGQQNYERAEKDFTQVIELNDAAGKPQTALVYSARGLSRAELEDNAGAQADLTEAIALSPDEPDYYKLRGMLRFIDEEQEAAGEDLRKAEELYKAQGEEDEDLNTMIVLMEQLGLL